MTDDINGASPRPLSFPGENVVLLPCDPGEFRDFVAGLFGRPQTIERHVSDPFEINKDNIINVHHLLEQRISAQNENSLMSFSASVEYDDGSTVTTNSISDWISYAEVKPLISESVTVQWTYLVRFINKSVPEKQDISITFSTLGFPRQFSLRDIILERIRYDGISYRISHTDRSWGSDIDALLNAQLKTFTKKRSDISRFFYRKSGLVGTCFGGSVAGGCIAGCIFAVNVLAAKLSSEAHVISDLKVMPQNRLNQQVDFLSRLEISGVWTKMSLSLVLFLLIASILSIVLAVYTDGALTASRPSFVLLTDAALENRRKKLKKLERNWKTFLLSAFGAVVLAVIANFLYADLVQFGL